ncbi:hypothetical protein CYPRO_2021 [Cyclonatronum proteinivorum]|uniref:Uncharacterized protein n=1 Tax=Cyclonatronum proteinivorum TaxID=1457365 RepID=A0A345ULB9_9BACT|nr:hypothetical protein CYPRO_2021 [Cyclonatronum proteinivorum]
MRTQPLHFSLVFLMLRFPELEFIISLLLPDGWTYE